MTYRDLMLSLRDLEEEQLDSDATVFLTGTAEYIPIKELDIVDETDVLEKNHPIIVVDF